MANADAAFGAKPVTNSSGHYTGHLGRYLADVSDALYIGDIVALEGTGDVDGVSSVIACTPCLIPVGIIVAIEVSKDLPEEQLHKKAADTVYLQVADSPDLKFHIQSDEAVVATDLSQNADLIFAEGSTATGRSRMELDHSTLGTTAALHMTLERVVQSPDNELGADAVVECSWNQHAYQGGQVGV